MVCPHSIASVSENAKLNWQLLKGFVGTGILFMAKAFLNGGKLRDPVIVSGG